MYRAKALGSARCEMFDESMHIQVRQRLKLESELRRALEHEEFRLHYQPVGCLESGRVTGLEALLRWQRPGVGLAYPADFIGVAEETGLIRAIGEWVLRHACAKLSQWHAEYPR
jgi:EAL domain-containing protein (putative c-di-GMP-specific phosphodiesterase class I)